MAITGTHLTTDYSGTDATSYNTASVSPSANKLVLATVHVEDGSAITAPSLSGNGLTWVKIAEIKQDSNRECLAVYRALGASPSSGAITIDFGGSTMDRCGWSVAEFGNVNTSGTNGSGAIVQSVTNSGTTGQTSLAVTLAAFASTGNATYGGFGKQTQSAITHGTDFTELGEDQAGDGFGMVQSQWKDSNDTSVDWSFTSSNFPVGIGIEIKAGGDFIPKVVFF